MTTATRATIRRTGYQSVALTFTDDEGERVTREFWVPALSSGREGYVREVTEARPGTLGAQVCGGLGHMGGTLTATPDGLLDLIRREWKAARAAERRAASRW